MNSLTFNTPFSTTHILSKSLPNVTKVKKEKEQKTTLVAHHISPPLNNPSPSLYNRVISNKHIQLPNDLENLNPQSPLSSEKNRDTIFTQPIHSSDLFSSPSLSNRSCSPILKGQTPLLLNFMDDWTLNLMNTEGTLSVRLEIIDREIIDIDHAKFNKNNLQQTTYNYVMEKWKKNHSTSSLSEKDKINEKAEINNLNDLNNKWQSRKYERVQKLKQLNIPLNNNELDLVLNAIEKLKKELKSDINHQKFNSQNPKFLSLILTDEEEKEREFTLLVFEGKEKEKVSLEVFLFNPNPFSDGGYKQVYYGYLLNKEPQRVVIAFTEFEDKERQLTALNEAHYLNLLHQHNTDGTTKYTPDPFKCFYVKRGYGRCQQQVVIMKYLPNSLHQVIPTLNDHKSKINLALQIANKIEFIHSLNLIHRDLKPANILMNELNQPVLIDFGFVCSADDKDTIEKRPGTLDYLSPQKLFNLLNLYTKKGAFSLDVWSFGVIFHEIIFGKKPWACKGDLNGHWINSTEVYNKIFNFANMTKDDLSPEMDLLRTIFEIDPEKRPSIKEIISCLIKCL